jgi:hypothetical protein
MAWVESVSPSFRARHDSGEGEDAARVLEALERMRDRLDDLFPRTVADLTVVLHGSQASLSASNPLFPLRRLLTAPGARPLIAGYVARRELHVLGPRALEARASGVTGARQMLLRSAPALYAHRVIVENNHELARARMPVRVATELRWAWLLEGSARWLAGQTGHARAALARRLRDGGRPRFPPTLRDAALLGGTIVDLLASEEGERAIVSLVTHLHPQGSRAALSKAFRGRALVHTEGEWRAHLALLAGAPRSERRSY